MVPKITESYSNIDRLVNLFVRGPYFFLNFWHHQLFEICLTVMIFQDLHGLNTFTLFGGDVFWRFIYGPGCLFDDTRAKEPKFGTRNHCWRGEVFPWFQMISGSCISWVFNLHFSVGLLFPSSFLDQFGVGLRFHQTSKALNEMRNMCGSQGKNSWAPATPLPAKSTSSCRFYVVESQVKGRCVSRMLEDVVLFFFGGYFFGICRSRIPRTSTRQAAFAFENMPITVGEGCRWSSP